MSTVIEEFARVAERHLHERPPAKIMGHGVMVLAGWSDPDQGWLPFVQLVLSAPYPKNNKADDVALHIGRCRVRHFTGQGRITPTPSSRSMYHHDDRCPQLPLPFVEFLSVTGVEFSEMMKHDCPSFERCRATGQLIERRQSDGNWKHIGGMLLWLKSNCRGRFFKAKGARIIFSRNDDAVAFDKWCAIERTPTSS